MYRKELLRTGTVRRCTVVQVRCTVYGVPVLNSRHGFTAAARYRSAGQPAGGRCTVPPLQVVYSSSVPAAGIQYGTVQVGSSTAGPAGFACIIAIIFAGQ